MPQLNVTGSPIQVPSQSGAEISGQNKSIYSLYLSSTPDVSPAINHAEIGPGGSFTWPGDKLLYICTVVGRTAALTYVNNGATLVSGTAFAQSSNQAVVLLETPFRFDAAAGTYTTGQKIVDVGNFASVYITFNVQGFGNSLTSSWIELFADFSSIGTGLTRPKTEDNRAQWLLGSGSFGQNYYKTPVKNRFLTLSLVTRKLLTTGFSSDGVMTVIGSNQVLSKFEYASNAGYLEPILGTQFGDLVTNVPFQRVTVPAGVTGNVLLNTKSGPYRAQINSIAVTNKSIRTDVYRNGTSIVLDYHETATPIPALINGTFPALPVRVTYNPGAQSGDLTISQD